MLLKRDYPEVKTPLYHTSALQLLIATMFSAQTLDATTNKVTPILFEKYKTLEDFAAADPEVVDQIIKGLNYHKTKAKNVPKMAQKLIDDFGGIVPHTIEELILLPGVGRKTANVVIAEWFSQPLEKRGNPWPGYAQPDIHPQYEDSIVVPAEGFVVDTHVIRTSNRLGLSSSKDPIKIEQDLMKIFPREEWADMSLRLIFHGRYRCKARDNQCVNDPEWKELCKFEN
jgi:endonuclease III